MGVHTGPAVERERDWFGATVNVASRVADLADADEVLVTRATFEAVGDPASELRLTAGKPPPAKPARTGRGLRRSIPVNQRPRTHLAQAAARKRQHGATKVEGLVGQKKKDARTSGKTARTRDKLSSRILTELPRLLRSDRAAVDFGSLEFAVRHGH